MLNTETKRKIQGLRDILVGKIPVPTDQVKQITLGLIYKFMSDIDKENTDILGGKSFFNGDYGRYSWNNIIDKSLSSYERVSLYSEGLEKMSLNPNIPELFRDIFRNAYLPFRDPATLSQFLVGINEFNYDHSEDLGDAFEFLLSVMASQGDAGQFRTPRHIIDFIVKVVEPKKTDTILDPACGTAGFLISAYKYILENNKAPDSNKPGSALSLTEKNKLTDNFVGYDISTDMVRLSLVNMYLHNFANPNIKEYDTLTSEDLWDEDFDCIMANPPFMTPKGGIRPHKRFAIRANRSEVLFVDYIAEHLIPSGKAGVIVPEGIIFQSSNAYKNLRKMLVDENYLYAVVSLPAGVFKPYSGVKTSILFMDKTIANKTSNILFVKVENDGFDLGAQRREIDKNDLPKSLEIILKYKQDILNNNKFELNEEDKKFTNIVCKEKIKESGDYNLTSARYIEILSVINRSWPFIKLGEIFEVSKGKKMENTNIPLENSKPYIVIDNLRFNKYSNYTIEKNGLYCNETDLLIIWDGANAGLAGSGLKGFVGSTCARLRLKIEANSKYLLYILRSLFTDLNNNTNGIAVPHLNKNYFLKIKIPLPSFEIQQEIVKELDEYQKIIDGARQVVENYKPKIEINPSWEKKKISQICDVVRGSSPRPKGDKRYYGGNIPRLMISDLTRDGMYTIPKTDYLTIEGSKLSRPMKKGDVIMAVSGNPGLPTILAVDACIHDGFVGFRNLSGYILPEFFYYSLLSLKSLSNSQSIGAIYKNLKTEQIKDFDIPAPNIKIQKQIVLKIKEEHKIIEENKKLIKIFKQKIKEKISVIWKK